jgi:Beta-propeller repeat
VKFGGEFVKLFAFCLILAGTALAANPAKAPADVLSGVPAWFEPTTGPSYISRSNTGLVDIGPAKLAFRANGRTDHMEWVGANPAKLSGDAFDGAITDYRVGPASQWRTHVPHFTRVAAANLYPGIDAVYYWNHGQFEFDLNVAPGHSVNAVRLQTSEAPKLLADGSVQAGEFHLKPAVAYQETASGRVPVEAGYRITDGEIAFTVGRYDTKLPLVIDPILFVGFFGGNQYGRANAIASTPEGVIYIVGGASANSDIDIPSTPKEQDLPAGRGDAFLARFTPDPSGALRMTHYTFWGGTFRDEARAVVTGKNGFVYFTGETESPDFPIYGARIQDPIGGELDAFLVIFKPEDPEGNNIWFSGYFGGAKSETSTAIAVDKDGAVYIGGSTNSPTIPVDDDGVTTTEFRMPGLQCCNRGASEGWMAKFDISLEKPLVYSTYIGGTATDAVTAIAVDANNNVYLAGNTSSVDFPATVLPLPVRRNDSNVFVTKLDLNRPGLDALVDSFYVYGNSIDIATGMVLSGNRLYVTGYTLSTDLPVTQTGYRNLKAASADSFILAFDYTQPAPFPVRWGTYFGGKSTDVAYGISVGKAGLVAIAGYTTSSDFPIVDSQNNSTLTLGSASAFLAVFDPAEQGDKALKLSRVVHGSVQDVATGVAADQSGRYFASGTSRSADLEVTNDSARLAEDGAEQSFIIRAAIQ